MALVQYRPMPTTRPAKRRRTSVAVVPRRNARLVARRAIRRVRRGYRRRRPAVRRSLPDMTLVALKFTETVGSIAIMTAPDAGRFYSLNSLYDPRSGLGGEQPLGYDQYTNFFQKYRVYAAKWKVHFFNPATGNDYDLRCVAWVGPHLNQPAGTDFEVFNQLPRARVRTLSQKSGTAKRATIGGFTKCHVAEAVSAAEYNTDLVYEATTNNNPAKIPRLMVGWYDPTKATQFGSVCSMQISITFYAKMFSRVNLIMS